MLEARILAVADVVDAVICFRPYREAMTIDIAMEALTAQREKQFDAGVVDIFLRIVSQGKLVSGSPGFYEIIKDLG